MLSLIIDIDICYAHPHMTNWAPYITFAGSFPDTSGPPLSYMSISKIEMAEASQTDNFLAAEESQTEAALDSPGQKPHAEHEGLAAMQGDRMAESGDTDAEGNARPKLKTSSSSTRCNLEIRHEQVGLGGTQTQESEHDSQDTLTVEHEGWLLLLFSVD